MRITQAVIQFRDKLCTLDTVLDEVMAQDQMLSSQPSPFFFSQPLSPFFSQPTIILG